MQRIPLEVYKNPRFSKKALLSLIPILLIALTMPIGIYLSMQRQNLGSKASTLKNIGETGFYLESVADLNNVQSEIPVRILIRSDQATANLFVAKINFPPNAMSVERIEKSSIDTVYKTFSKKWITDRFDNTQGVIDLVSGVPNPGFKTDSSKPDKYLLATIIFKPKTSGEAEIQLSDSSAIFRNQDNLNILDKKNSLKLTLSDQLVTASDSALEKDLIEIKSPIGGRAYAYSDPINIQWSTPESEQVKKVTISLQINNSDLGIIARSITNSGQFSFDPQKFLPVTFAIPENDFNIKIEGENKDQQKIIGANNFPFVISTTAVPTTSTSSAGLENNADLNGDGIVNFTDLSILLSDFNNKTELAKKADLNNDGEVGSLDLYLVKEKMEGK